MKRVLFVDDEINVLQGLRRSLRSMRREWDMSFETSGEAALDAMSEEPFDIVVSDMRMPGMDGAELLARVKERHPDTIRVILSGQSEKESVMKSVGATHQYLSKPCEAEKLKAVISKASQLRELLGSDHLKALVATLDTIPSMPSVYQQIVTELEDPNASLERLGELIATDIGMSAKILQIVNSAYFGVLSPVSSVPRAVAFLGLETVTGLVLGVHIFSELDTEHLADFSPETLMRHSTETAAFGRVIARALGTEKQVRDDAFLAGMLHEVGHLVLASNLPADYTRACALVANGSSRSAAFREVFGATSGEVGAYLMGIWGLPDAIVEAIAFCESPSDAMCEEVGPLAITHLAHGFSSEGADSSRRSPSAIDMGYVERLGVRARMEEWRAACLELSEESAASPGTENAR